MNSSLKQYVDSARNQKISDKIIKESLIQAGWKEQDVTSALTPQSSSALVPPPPPIEHFGMWVAFEYIIFFISLYVFATAVGGLMHQAVDQYIHDSLDTTISSYGTTNWLTSLYLASLIVSFPICSIFLYILGKQAVQKPSVKNIRARKILIYITLVGTFLIMMGHLIGTIYSFLSGGLTTRLFGHLGVTFLVAGSIFGILLYIVKEDRHSV